MAVAEGAGDADVAGESADVDFYDVELSDEGVDGLCGLCVCEDGVFLAGAVGAFGEEYGLP